MEVESFEPYHVGTKLRSTVDILLFKKKIKNKLKEYKYKIIENTDSDSVIPRIEDLAIKDDVRVILAGLNNALNTVGDDPDKVIDVFQEVNKSILDLGYEEESTISFYEIITHINIKVKVPPKNILNKHAKSILDLFKNYGRLNAIGIRLSDKLPEDTEEYVDIGIEPKPTSPNTYLLINIVFRSSDKQKIIDFHQNLETNIQEIIKNI